MDLKTRDVDPARDPGASGRESDREAEPQAPELEAPTPAELAREETSGAPAVERPEPEAERSEGAGAARPEAGADEGPAAARDYKDRWLRAEAELINFRRRAQRDLEEARQFAEERGLLATLEHLDDLERALEAARSAGAPESWVEGVELVSQRMRDHLARHGVSEIAAVGVRFDPEVHEAMLEVDARDEIPPGHVVQVVRKGYQLRGRALRPARVVVARQAD